MSNPPPVSPITVEIKINAEHWRYVRMQLDELAAEANRRDVMTFDRMCGGVGGGSYYTDVRTREVSQEQYRAELQAWMEANRAERDTGPGATQKGSE